MGNNIRETSIPDIYSQLLSGPAPQLADIINLKKNELGITDYQMSKILGIPKNTFYRILKRISDGEIDTIDFFTVVKLSQLFNIDISDLTKTYVASLSTEKIKEIEASRKAHYILNTFDLKGLKDMNFIESISDFEGIEHRIVNFFGLRSIFDYTHEVGRVLFSKLKNSNDKMRELWVRSAFFIFDRIQNPHSYDREMLKSLVQNIRPYTRNEEKGLLIVQRALYAVGVTVIFQSSIPKAKVRGGTFYVNGKPCIAITDFNKNYATLWFALMHELYHVLNDMDQISKLKYCLTEDGAADLFLLQEEDADWFAREMLFPQEYMNFIKHHIKSHSQVEQYAKEKRVHPSIIYSFYCFQQKQLGENVYGIFTKYFGKTEASLFNLRQNPFDKATILEGIELYKNRLTTKI